MLRPQLSRWTAQRAAAALAQPQQCFPPAARAAALRRRCYSTSPIASSPPEAAASTATDGKDATASATDDVQVDVSDPKGRAVLYGERRTAYNKAVSSLRKKYADEYARIQKRDETIRLERQARIERAKLERRRLKNLKAAENARRDMEKKAQRRREFEEELRVAQMNRDARKVRFQKARQLIVDELESECHLWLTTSSEVEQTLSDPAVEQELWSRPGGIVGAPPRAGGVEESFVPDADFWRYECHTWDMSKTYPTPRELLLEELEEVSYLETNVDGAYWTEEKIEQASSKEAKARLRAMVREEGRKALLERQRRWMEDSYGRDGKAQAAATAAGSGGKVIPTAMPAPKLDVLADFKAMEEEGIKILREDPDRFFQFETTDDDDLDDDIGSEEGGGTDVERHRGGTRGRPLGLRDPIRDANHGDAYPRLIGIEPKPDTRTEREKKREEREERMRAAAEAAARGGESSDQESAVQFAAEDDVLDDDGSEPINYDEMHQYDTDNLEWEEGLDPSKPEDAILLSTPRDKRYTEDDVDWVLERLKEKAKKLEEQIRYEEGMLADQQRQEAAATVEGEKGGDGAVATDELDDKKSELEKALGDGATKSVGVDERGREYVQYDFNGPSPPSGEEEGEGGDFDLGDLGDELEDLMAGLEHVDLDGIESVLSSLTSEQRSVLEAMEIDDDASIDEMTTALRKVPGLTDEQIKSLIDLELSLKGNEELKEALEKDENN